MTYRPSSNKSIFHYLYIYSSLPCVFLSLSLANLPTKHFYLECCQISAMADCGGGFFNNRHDLFVKDDITMVFCGGYGGAYGDFWLSVTVCHPPSIILLLFILAFPLMAIKLSLSQVISGNLNIININKNYN